MAGGLPPGAELKNVTNFTFVLKIGKRRKNIFNDISVYSIFFFTFCNSAWVPRVPALHPVPRVIKIIFAPIIVRILALTVFQHFGKAWQYGKGLKLE